MAGQASDDVFKQVVDNFAQRTRDYAQGIASRLGTPFNSTQLSDDQAVRFWNYSPKYGTPEAADQAYHTNVAQGMPPGQALDDAYPMRKLLYQQGTDLSDHIDSATRLQALAAKDAGTEPAIHPPSSTMVTLAGLQAQGSPQGMQGPPPAPPQPPPGPPAMGPVQGAPMSPPPQPMPSPMAQPAMPGPGPMMMPPMPAGPM